MNLKNKMYEEITLTAFKVTTKGKIVEALLYILPALSVVAYYKLGVNIILALIFGFLTRSILGALSDSLISKLFRIDKQFAWLTETPDGMAELKKKGFSLEQIEDMKKELGFDTISKL